MKNDKVILGTVVMLVSLNTALPGLANQVSDALNDAEVAVINQQAVDAQVLRSHGDEYTREFLLQFHNATQKYRQAFQLGLADQGKEQGRSFSSQVERATYQRGLEKGKMSDQKQINSEVNHLEGQPTKEQQIDHEKYSPKKLSPNQAQFINRIAKDAQQVGKDYDLYPSIIIAQAALESNWGTSELSLAPHHNLFGVKGRYQGQGVLKPTTEFVGSRSKQVQDVFRSYASNNQSLQDYAKTLQQPLYNQVHRSTTKSYREATHALVNRYATDPGYNKKLNRLIESYQLTRYDNPKEEGNEQGRVRNNRQFGLPQKSHLQTPRHQENSQNKKISPVVSIIGGAASAGALTGLKKLLIS